MVLQALTDPDGFADRQRAAAADPAGLVESGARDGASADPAELLARWRDGRNAVLDGLARAGERRLPWFGPAMSATSMATARIMETWAHGTDIADALGIVRAPTERLRHVAHLGVITRDYAYRLRGRPPPADALRIELEAPDGTRWVWGPDDRPPDVAGPAIDFCLLVTQRRNPADLRLGATDQAREWLSIAQAFAGPQGAGRRPMSGVGHRHPSHFR
jgi:uncharacterized protein (TIGR03084 family)